MTSPIGLAIAHAPKAEPGNLKASVSKARVFHDYLQFCGDFVCFGVLSDGGLSRSSTYAAIHENARPGNVCCARSGKEGYGLCDLAGLTIAGN
ncbi:hypothetical protein GCM10010924_47990 [Rhizobium wenxiniae]|nr:hypothetical protein GCM10010924_47990 [Rhizobium wenxiniae]